MLIHIVSVQAGRITCKRFIVSGFTHRKIVFQLRQYELCSSFNVGLDTENSTVIGNVESEALSHL